MHIIRLSYRLLQRPSLKPQIYSDVGLRLLDFQNTIIHRLEDWAQEHDLHYAISLDTRGTYKKARLAYENVIRNFIGSGSDNLRLIVSLVDWPTEKTTDIISAWGAYQTSWPLIWRLMRNSAYLAVVSAWRNDYLSSKLYIDALIEWAEPFQYDLEMPFYLRSQLITPAIAVGTWLETQEGIKPFFKYDHCADLLNPKGVFSAVVYGSFDDMRFLVALIYASWIVRGLKRDREPIDYALDLMSSLRRDQSGSASALALLAYIRVISCGDRIRNEGYAASIDEAIDLFDGMTERPEIPGRAYTPTTMRSRNDLQGAFALLLIIVAASDQEQSVTVQKITDTVLEEIPTDAIFPSRDNTLRDVLQKLRQLSEFLNGSLPSQFLDVFNMQHSNKDINATKLFLVGVLASIERALNEQRASRLQEREVDQPKLNAIARALSDGLYNGSDVWFPIGKFNNRIEVSGIEKRKLFSIGSYSKGTLTNPPMDDTAVNEIEFLANYAREHLAFYSFCDLREQSQVSEKTANDGESYWNVIRSFRDSYGDCVLAISGGGIPKWLLSWQLGSYSRQGGIPLPTGLKIWRRDRDGDGGYLFTLNDIEVFKAPVERGVSYLIPLAAFDAVEYSRLGSSFVTVSYEPSADDPFTGSLVIEAAFRVKTSGLPILKIIHGSENEE